MNLIDLWYSGSVIYHPDDEWNPIMSRVFADFGMRGIAAYKGIALGALFCFVPILRKNKILELAFYLSVGCYTTLTFYHIWGYLMR